MRLLIVTLGLFALCACGPKSPTQGGEPPCVEPNCGPQPDPTLT
jgi:hypothetical protein